LFCLVGSVDASLLLPFAASHGCVGCAAVWFAQRGSNLSYEEASVQKIRILRCVFALVVQAQSRVCRRKEAAREQLRALCCRTASTLSLDAIP
jgi:hypothetical protein